MIKLFKCLFFLVTSFAIQPYYIIVKTYDGNNNNALLNIVRFNYERETQRDSAYDEMINYYQLSFTSIGGTAFLDTIQNSLIVIDWE